MSGNNYHALVGSEVYSSDGSDVGSVKAIAGNDGETPFLQVEHNGLFAIGADSFLIPVDAITSTEAGKVTVNRSAEQMIGIPAHDSSASSEPGYFSSVYTWWWRANEN